MIIKHEITVWYGVLWCGMIWYASLDIDIRNIVPLEI